MSKEAIADYDEIRKEIRLALQDCGRKLSTYIRRRARQKREGERRSIFERYIPEVVAAVRSMTRVNTDQLRRDLLATARRITEQADIELDENGKPIKKPAELDIQSENTIVVDPEDDPPTGQQLLIDDGDPATPKRKGKSRSKTKRRSRRRAS